MKKILLISFEYPIGKAYCGGVGQIVERSRKSLLGLGYEVYVLISPEFSRKHPVELFLPDDSLKVYRSLGAFLNEHDWSKFEFIIHHFVNWTCELKKIKSRKGRRPKIIYHFHSILRREKDSGFRTLNHFLLRQEKMIGLADKIVCPSLYEYDNFSRYFPLFIDKVSVIENTIESYPADKRRIGEIKKRLGIIRGDVVSLYVGRLERIKGAHILLKEVPRILAKYRHLKVVFIGKSLEKDLYLKLLRICRKFPRQFFYMKYVDKNELFQYYYLSNIYINSSLSESFSLSTHESALCNNALLLNFLPVFEKFKNSAMFFNAKEGDFPAKYERLIKCPSLRAELSRKAKAVANKFLSRNMLKKDLRRLLCD
ncbi:MAG: glycosyltransferase family 4 protein [Candidatus Omnitrophica bacterium]|nr:glycosyltransferase family 4 protein [Candidatus Omnitrophota bacterium]